MTAVLHVLGIIAALFVLWLAGAVGSVALWILAAEIGARLPTHEREPDE